ncbi:protein Mss18p [Monosporozyma unispora]
MSCMEYITRHCAVCQIKLLRPRGVTANQLIQVSNRVHSDLERICNILYTKGQFPARVPLDVRKLIGPYNPKLFLILGTGDLSVLFKVLSNIKGVGWDSNKPIDCPSPDVSTKLFDMDTSKKDRNLITALHELHNNPTQSSILRYLKINDSVHLNDTITSYSKKKIPLYDPKKYEFKWNSNKLTDQISSHSQQTYSTDPNLIEWVPEIFTNLYGLPNDMKLWLRDIEYCNDLDELLSLKPQHKDELDILLHGFKGL